MANLSIEVACPECGSNHHVNARLAGRKVRCPHCDALVEVPQPAAPADTQAVIDRQRQAAESDSGGDVSSDGQGIPEPLEPVAAAVPVQFASEPVFDSAGHHAVTDLPSLPPALQMDEDEGDPQSRNKRKDEGLDMTPMVDVTFLLLIFFMVTASFSLQKSIPMPRQQTDAPSPNVQEEEEEDIDMVTVQIDEFGSFLVLAPDWERETPGKQNLVTALREAIGESGGAVRLVIEVHEDAKLRFLVDCMDAGTIAGYSEAQITQVEEFD